MAGVADYINLTPGRRGLAPHLPKETLGTKVLGLFGAAARPRTMTYPDILLLISILENQRPTILAPKSINLDLSTPASLSESFCFLVVLRVPIDPESKCLRLPE
jgi:predicted nucleotidyltransferase